MAIQQLTPEGGILITGKDIDWFRLVAMLLAVRMELCGIQMTRGIKASVLMKGEIGLKKSHPNRMMFMYANNVMFAKGLIKQDLWKQNIHHLQTRFND